MLTDEEIMDIRNRAKLNDNRQINPMLFARDIERAVLAKAMPIPKQESFEKAIHDASLKKVTQESLSVVEAAQNVMKWIEARHRPPVDDMCGGMALVRLHALEDLGKALDAQPAQPAAIPECHCEKLQARIRHLERLLMGL